MNIYEIDSRIAELVDPETGEILDLEALDALQMERERKIDNLIKLYRNTVADYIAVSDEMDRLHDRRETLERQKEGIKNFLGYVLGGQKYKSATATVYYNTSKSVDITDEDKLRAWAADNGHGELFRKPELPKPDKAAIKKLIDSGEEVPYCGINTNSTLCIR